MSTSVIELRTATAKQVDITYDFLVISLHDGRTASVPLAWYPRLWHGKRAEREKWRLIGEGEGIHWPDLDEDISVEDILRGIPSQESQQSLKRWLKSRSE